MDECQTPVFQEKADHTIQRLKYLHLEIKVLDKDCAPKQLEHAVRVLYMRLKHGKKSY